MTILTQQIEQQEDGSYRLILGKPDWGWGPFAIHQVGDYDIRRTSQDDLYEVARDWLRRASWYTQHRRMVPIWRPTLRVAGALVYGYYRVVGTVLTWAEDRGIVKQSDGLYLGSWSVWKDIIHSFSLRPRTWKIRLYHQKLQRERWESYRSEEARWERLKNELTKVMSSE